MSVSGSVLGSTALSFSEDQAMVLDVARSFCRDKSTIAAVRALLESEQGFDPEIWRQMVDMGWPGMALPEAVGGSGLGIAAMVPVMEAMGRSLLGGPLLSSVLASQLLLRARESPAEDALLATLAAGAPATVALLDSHDWGASRIRCELGADGVLQGSKQQVMDAAVAEWFVVVAQQAGEPVLVLVAAADVPVSARRDHSLIDCTRRAQAIDFSAIKVAEAAVVRGPRVASALRDLRLLGALLVAAEAGGSAAACLDTTVEYLKTRKQFGKLIGSYQALKHPCVDILIGVDSTRSFVYHAATLLTEDALDRDAEIACRMAKTQATETLKFAGDRAIQFHGGMGFTWECDAQLYVRRAQWTQQAFGDAQHHRKQLASLLLDR
ncbi:acyl-CoA dehydrogenase family protein [Haliea sp. E1-2-M8]|uniref:acyl-CoA dehydrogenase family protein n=1 Tax=Haliea sp. E1-2-M8 TaxID=3064706 RepID=UPI002727E640|nr:acyl-CoA dehydrogenase family protein [Haliea sp. E1-2-M8]MDO8860613.1 acyl-CoA dehydrogenase family protein [Haliea sp. E1-2-M8]